MLKLNVSGRASAHNNHRGVCYVTLSNRHIMNFLTPQTNQVRSYLNYLIMVLIDGIGGIIGGHIPNITISTIILQAVFWIWCRASWCIFLDHFGIMGRAELCINCKFNSKIFLLLINSCKKRTHLCHKRVACVIVSQWWPLSWNFWKISLLAWVMDNTILWQIVVLFDHFFRYSILFLVFTVFTSSMNFFLLFPFKPPLRGTGYWRFR